MPEEKEKKEKIEKKEELLTGTEKKSEVLDNGKKEVEENAEKSAVKEVKKRKSKKNKTQILKGRANIKCTYNNTLINIADLNGNILGWSSSGLLGFKGAKKATPYAATQVVANVSEKAKKYGVRELEVSVKGVGSGREASIRALGANGFELTLIKDDTPIPHNGCRPKKPRRV
jgi:small subunit ribosomal protein S11